MADPNTSTSALRDQCRADLDSELDKSSDATICAVKISIKLLKLFKDSMSDDLELLFDRICIEFAAKEIDCSMLHMNAYLKFQETLSRIGNDTHMDDVVAEI